MKPFFSMTLAAMTAILVSNVSDAADAVKPLASLPLPNMKELSEKNHQETMLEANLMKSALKTWQDRVVSKQVKINQILAALELDKLANEIRLKQNMLQLLELLDHEAAAIEQAFEEVTPDMRHYVKALNEAPDVYMQIAANFDRFAHETDDALFKTLYADFATDSRKLSKYYTSRATDVTALSGHIESQMKVVRESRVFVKRVSEYVRALPTNYGLETERFAERLNGYIKTFNDSVKTMRGVAEQLDASRTKS